VSDVTIVFVILGAVVVLFVWNRIPVELVAVGAAVSLWATGILDVQQALSGFGDPTVVFIACLFVVSEALDATGVTAWAGQQLVPRVGESRTRLLAATVILVALLTALISVNGAVAALLPMVAVLAIRLGRSPSLLMMPLAFGAHAGSLLALTGTPVNVLVSEAADEATGHPFSFFSFTLVGAPLVAATVVIMVLLAPRLLPDRAGGTRTANVSDQAMRLVEEYKLADGTAKLAVTAGSPLIGRSPGAVALTAYPGAVMVGIRKHRTGLLGAGLLATANVEAGDLVLVQAEPRQLDRLAADLRLAPTPSPSASDVADSLLNRDLGVVEVVVRPRSGLIGHHVTPGMLTDSGELVILAVRRNGKQLFRTDVDLLAGDTLLVQGSWRALDINTADPDVLVVDPPSLVRRQAVPLGPRSTTALAVVGAMVMLLATGLIPAAMAGLLAAGSLVLLRVVTVEQAYRAISWTTIVIVAGMIPLSQAIQSTGAAEKVANVIVDVVGDSSPYLLVVTLFVLTAVLGQLISNTATALVVIPIAVSAAQELGVSPRPVLMSITVAAAASFLTPVATPANMMVMGPGGYRFTDYWKLGIVMMGLFLVVATLVPPLVWPF
jgi:di/tricarboxylate transporter